MTQAQEDGYVECGECGHPIEQHADCVLVGCSCPMTYTPTEVRRIRVREGLSADWIDREWSDSDY